MRKARILSWSAKNHPDFMTQEQLLDVLRRQLADSAGLKADLICFSEMVLAAGADRDNPNTEENNRAALSMMREAARRLHTNIVVSLRQPSQKYTGRWYNASYVLDRQGETVGVYHKRHPTDRELAAGCIPGQRLPVFDLDIGRIGVLTCFDAGWREDWQALHDRGAELVVWNAAYDGGYLPSAYAAIHGYYVVTSVWRRGQAHSRILDPMGRELAHTSRWDDLAMADAELDVRFLHTDNHWDKIAAMRRALGDRVRIEVDGETNIIAVSSADPDWPMERVMREFGLTSYADYHRQADALREVCVRDFPEE